MSSSQQKLASPCPINALADEDLAKIFKYLQPYERLRTSEVSKRWCGISRIPWRDIDHLDLSSTPGENIGAIVKQCPNLRTVFAKGNHFSLDEPRHVFPLNQPHLLSGEHLSSVKLYQCSVAIRDQANVENTRIPVLPLLVSYNLNAPLKELVLYDLDIHVRDILGFAYIGNLPASLERLQLNMAELSFPQRVLRSDLRCRGLLLDGLGRLNQLTCLSLHSSHDCPHCHIQWKLDLRRELPALQNLRELCIGGDELVLRLPMPRLEVLFLNDALFIHEGDADFQKLAKRLPALRILCVTGRLVHGTFPVRRRFPNGFGTEPVPKLHVFVGKEASENIIFTKSPVDVLEIHAITEPLPKFLAKEEIAPLFEGVWIAAQIKECAKYGSNWWKYEGDTATSFRTAGDA